MFKNQCAWTTALLEGWQSVPMEKGWAWRGMETRGGIHWDPFWVRAFLQRLALLNATFAGERIFWGKKGLGGEGQGMRNGCKYHDCFGLFEHNVLKLYWSKNALDCIFEDCFCERTCHIFPMTKGHKRYMAWQECFLQAFWKAQKESVARNLFRLWAQGNRIFEQWVLGDRGLCHWWMQVWRWILFGLSVWWVTSDFNSIDHENYHLCRMDQWRQDPEVEVPDEVHSLELEKELGYQTKVLLWCRDVRDLGVLEEKKGEEVEALDRRRSD